MENLRHGFIYGTKKFANYIKSTYLPQEPDNNFPQLKNILRDKDPDALLYEAVAILGCDMDELKRPSRSHVNLILNRDLLLYLLKETGLYTNREIGDFFDLTHSAVSRRVSIIRPQIAKDSRIGSIYEELRSKIKV